MSKTFTYFRKTGENRRPVDYGFGIEYEDDGDEGYNFEYTPEKSSLLNALAEIVSDNYFGEVISQSPEIKNKITTKVIEFISEMNFEEDLADAFEKELKDYFEDEAQERESYY